MTLQYESYRAALAALPSILPDLDLQEFVSVGELALEHFELFSDNSTVNDPFYTGGQKMMTETFEKIAYQYEYVFDGDLESSVAVYEEDLVEIQSHLTAIANAWDATADALERALQSDGTLLPIIVSSSIVGIVVLVIVFTRRRSSM